MTVALVLDGESEWQHLVIVAELIHEELVGLPPWLCFVMYCMCFPHMDHIVSVGHTMSAAFNLQEGLIFVKA